MRATKSHSTGLSLEGMHSTVPVPSHHEGWWKHWRAFVGPAVLVSVGYMDPGNWGTDLDRKSTRLNSSHPSSSYAVFCLKKKRDPASSRSIHSSAPASWAETGTRGHLPV